MGDQGSSSGRYGQGALMSSSLADYPAYGGEQGDAKSKDGFDYGHGTQNLNADVMGSLRDGSFKGKQKLLPPAPQNPQSPRPSQPVQMPQADDETFRLFLVPI